MATLGNSLICLLAIFSFLSSSSAAASKRSTYIIHMDTGFMPKEFAHHHHWYASTLQSVISFDADSADISTPSPIYMYEHVIHGFSAAVSPEELQSLAKTEGFVSAYPDARDTLDTTYAFEFLSLSPATGLWPASKYGEDVIIGVIDSGVWPESKSFKDEGMTEVPQRWMGKCLGGADFDPSLCNRKLIGAQFFNKGLRAAEPEADVTDSARDTGGHGTHTASIVAGNFVEGVSYFGYAAGTARGAAPYARLAIYKSSWDDGYYQSDKLAAMDQAIADGVDIISVSSSKKKGGVALYEDAGAIASFAAMEKGIFVSMSAGNKGPDPWTVGNAIPWALTVASGSMDREFAAVLTVGNGTTITGFSSYPGNASVVNVPLFYSENSTACDTPVSPPGAQGTVVVCSGTPSTSPQTQMETVSKWNVMGAVFINSDMPSGFFTSPVVIIIRQDDSTLLLDYVKNNAEATVTMKFKQTLLGKTEAPVVALSSSRGPSRSFPSILKPDLMAPGMSILAAVVPTVATAQVGDTELFSAYGVKSGTSMACPHASGVAALLRAVHPDWSPAAIRSAMMTTASPLDKSLQPILDQGMNYAAASVIDIGAGHVEPNKAMDPGLIYDAGPADYVSLLCATGFTQQQITTITRSSAYNCSGASADLNYPSFIVVMKPDAASVVQEFARTVTNVGSGPASYNVSVQSPVVVRIGVEPQLLVFKEENEKISYRVRVEVGSWSSGEKSLDGAIVWADDKGRYKVRSPVVVVKGLV